MAGQKPARLKGIGLMLPGLATLPGLKSNSWLKSPLASHGWRSGGYSFGCRGAGSTRLFLAIVNRYHMKEVIRLFDDFPLPG